MKIATWNIERPYKNDQRVAAITKCLQEINADIVILTETNELIDLGNAYTSYHSAIPSEEMYKPGEKRVGIYSRYEIIEKIRVSNDSTSICLSIKTPFGELAVYGTVIGIYGNRTKEFTENLTEQVNDFINISSTNNLAICGDLNISFSDNYYFTENGRQVLTTTFKNLGLVNLTASISENIDHIILPEEFIQDRKIETECWNIDKKLSDHIGVAITVL